MTQLSLLAGVEREERPWKVVRRVSRQVYAELRKSGAVARSTARVIVSLAWYRNSTQVWPTAAELTAFMFDKKRLPRNDTKLVAPRLTELLKGKVIHRPDGRKVRLGGGVLTLGPVRKCRVTGGKAHPVCIREAGSSAREAA